MANRRRFRICFRCILIVLKTDFKKSEGCHLLLPIYPVLPQSASRVYRVCARDGRIGSKVGQIGPKWDKSGTLTDQILVYFGSPRNWGQSSSSVSQMTHFLSIALPFVAKKFAQGLKFKQICGLGKTMVKNLTNLEPTLTWDVKFAIQIGSDWPQM